MLQEIAASYPAYFQEFGHALAPEALQAYERQYECVQALCQVYEQDGGNYPRITQLLTEMQECGAPPPELVEEMSEQVMPGGLGGLGGLGADDNDLQLPPGLDAADPSKCSIQ